MTKSKIFCAAAITVMTTVAAFISTAQEPTFNLTETPRPVGGRSGYNATHPESQTGPGKLDPRLLDPANIKHAPSPADAVAYALADAATLNPGDQPFQRYVWNPTGDKKKVGEINYTVNLSWNRSTILVPAKPVANGRLVRLDLRALAPRFDIAGNDFKQLFELWEKLAIDEPYFHITRSADEILPTNAKLIQSVEGDPTGSARFTLDDATWFKSATGKTYCLTDGKWVSTKLPTSKERVAVAAPHVGLDQHVLLQGLTQSAVPIVRNDWWEVRSLTSTNGGIYYDLIGIERKPKVGTALQAFFKKFGINEEEVQKIRSDQRVAMFKSKVTGRPRRVDVFRGIGVRPDSGTGLATITFDPSEEQIKAENDPIRNLLDFKFAASEVIVERNNGSHVFALFNAAGDLQDSAPDNVVKDHTIPAPYTARLQSAISCIRCHAPFDGWQPAQNDVKLMLAGYLDVFDDLSDKKGNIPDVLDRLVGLYSGDLTKALRRGRDDYSDAVFVMTGGQTVPQAGASLSATFVDYLYTDVDSYMACRELGFDVPPDKATYYLNMLLPPLSKDIIGISPEDPVIGALKIGLRVQRFQFEAVYADAAFRALQTQKQWNKGKK